MDERGSWGGSAWADSMLIGGWQMQKTRSELRRIAPTELTAVVSGESGTGKEVVARELHRSSGRRGPFCPVNCAAIPASLMESELFGYKRGAFSGADRDKPGLVRTAHGGTLLLDEIGDMPLEAQAKLLRVLQTREVWPLGATAAEHVDVRVVCATHRDLLALQREGRFREDLYARLNDYHLRLPALRERKEDMLMLVRAFLERHGRPNLAVSFPYILALLSYDWPYNVRELESCIKRSIALTRSESLGESELPDTVRAAMVDYGRPWNEAPAVAAQGTVHDAGSSRAGILRRTGPQVPSEEQLRALLGAHRGNVAAVGRQLGKARMQIHRWLKRYGIRAEDFR
jgi:DNA-binding NtrC family response regulator